LLPESFKTKSLELLKVSMIRLIARPTFAAAPQKLRKLADAQFPQVPKSQKIERNFMRKFH
jgi:hypothetical protein